MDEEKLKHISLAHQNGFGTTFLHNLLRLVKGTTKPNTCQKKCNKYDLTIALYLWLVDHNDWSMWFAISNFPPICSPSFDFMGRVEKIQIIKLGWEKHFCKVTNWTLFGMFLQP